MPVNPIDSAANASHSDSPAASAGDSAPATKLNYLDIAGLKSENSPLKPGQPLEPVLHHFFTQMGVPEGGSLEEAQTEWAFGGEHPSKKDAFVAGLLNGHQLDFDTMFMGDHMSQAPLQYLWKSFIGTAGTTEADVTKFDQFQAQYDAVVKNNPEMAKANAIFEYASEHFDALADKGGLITPASLQAALVSGKANSEDVKMINMIKGNMTALKESELAPFSLDLLHQFPSELSVDKGPFAVEGLSLPGLQNYALDAYKKAANPSSTDSRRMETVLQIRQEIMHPEG